MSSENCNTIWVSIETLFVGFGVAIATSTAVYEAGIMMVSLALVEKTNSAVLIPIKSCILQH